MSKQIPEVRDPEKRKLLRLGLSGAVVVASAAGLHMLRLPDGSETTTQGTGANQGAGSSPADPTFDADGVQLPSLTSDPSPHRAGSIYFRSDLLEMRLDDGVSYYTIQKMQVFSKGGVVLSPTAQKLAIWRAPFSCTVTAVKAYQDVGSGSVVTAYDNTTNLLDTNITLSSAATWQDGGSLAQSGVSEGDSIAIAVVSVAGSPNYISIQVEFTQP